MVWGFLKYHHPTVAKGKYDWDKEFIENLRIIDQLDTKEEINNFYYRWISDLSKLKKNAKRTPPTNAILSNYEFSWLKDTSVFTKQVTALLLQVQNNTRAKNHYVKSKFFGLAAASYVNEEPYKDSTYPSKEMRLLTLARYWNIVNYFYPYKYLTDTYWQNVLDEFVPKFIESGDIRNYHLTLLQLFAKLNDSHSGFNSGLYSSAYKTPPFSYQIIDEKIIVLYPLNDSLCKLNDIRYGDVILKVNGESVKSLIDHYSHFISASNYSSLCKQISSEFLGAGVLDSVQVTYERDGKSFNKILPAYYTNASIGDYLATKKWPKPGLTRSNYRIFNDNIAYVNLGIVRSKNEMRQVLEQIKNTNGVILDIRNYPNSQIFGTVTNFFCTSKKPFAKFAKQSIKYPGVLTWARTVYCGSNSGKKYNGKVVVLINEQTISFAEYFTMALKTIPNVSLIGSHTAGADGGNHHFILPGNIVTSFSNEAVYYPNGDETQRKGIVPDITVLPTIEGMRSRKDEVLEKAIEILSRK
jgi:carboxyl-terminal processing protease